MKEMSLDNWRRQLDDIDRSIVGKIADRLEIVAQVAKAKRGEIMGGDGVKGGRSAADALTSLSILRPMREKALLINLFAQSQNTERKKGAFLVYAIWRLFFGRSYKEQGLQRILGLVHTQADSSNELKDLASFHFGVQLPYEEVEVSGLEKVGSDHDLCVYDSATFCEGVWWSSLWASDARILVNGTLPQVRLCAPSDITEAEKKRWWWWSDEDIARFWLISPHGGKEWSGREWPMDRLLFGVRVADVQAFGENHAELLACGGKLLGSGAEKVTEQEIHHRLYFLPGDQLQASTPDEMEAVMSSRFCSGVLGDGQQSWRLLGGYAMPLDMEAKDFFEG